MHQCGSRQACCQPLTCISNISLHLEHTRAAAASGHAAQRAGSHQRARHARARNCVLARRVPQHGLLAAQQAAQRPAPAAA